jgi:c-di-GMP-binding flagellar brake protein YcgR
MHEKRTTKRIDLDLIVEGQLVKRNFKTPLTAPIRVRTVDVSKGGARLRWPAGWDCESCDNCAGWVFKKGMSQPLDRNLNIGIRIKLRFHKKSLSDREYYAKIVWTQSEARTRSAYEAGLSFIDADRELERELGL